MSYMMKSLFQIMVPCSRNTGVPFRTRHHREWDRQVQLITGGLTILPPSRGRWVDKNTNKVYFERMIPVNIIADADEMKKVAQITIKHYDQLAVMYYKLSDEPYIVYKDK